LKERKEEKKGGVSGDLGDRRRRKTLRRESLLMRGD